MMTDKIFKGISRDNPFRRDIYLEDPSTAPVETKRLSLKKSLKVKNHSPSGFNWGYSGSGPSQTALAILCEVTANTEALQYYQKFKDHFIATMPNQTVSWYIKASLVELWLSIQRNGTVFKSSVVGEKDIGLLKDDETDSD